MNIREIALQTISIEALTIQRLSSAIDDTYEAAVNAIYNSTGRVVVTGIGKSAIIGQKIVATMNSTGTPFHIYACSGCCTRRSWYDQGR